MRSMSSRPTEAAEMVLVLKVLLMYLPRKQAHTEAYESSFHTGKTYCKKKVDLDSTRGNDGLSPFEI